MPTHFAFRSTNLLSSSLLDLTIGASALPVKMLHATITPAVLLGQTASSVTRAYLEP
jgi:hypothetical protein